MYIALAVCVVFIALVAVARRRGLIRGAPFVYNFSLVLVYVVIVFFVMPLFDSIALVVSEYGVSLFGSVRDLHSDLEAWNVAADRKNAVVAAYFFTVIWFYIAVIVIAGLAIGFGRFEVEISYKENGGAPPSWGWVIFSSSGVIITSMLVVPDLISSPMEPVGSRCLRGCNWLNLGVFPYFGKFILLGFSWNIFVYIFLFNLMWRINWVK